MDNRRKDTRTMIFWLGMIENTCIHNVPNMLSTSARHEEGMFKSISKDKARITTMKAECNPVSPEKSNWIPRKLYAAWLEN